MSIGLCTTRGVPSEETFENEGDLDEGAPWPPSVFTCANEGDLEGVLEGDLDEGDLDATLAASASAFSAFSFCIAA